MFDVGLGLFDACLSCVRLRLYVVDRSLGRLQRGFRRLVGVLLLVFELLLDRLRQHQALDAVVLTARDRRPGREPCLPRPRLA